MLAAYATNLVKQQTQSFDPSTLNPDFWLDTQSRDYFTSAIAEDNLDLQMSTITTRDSNAYISTALSSGDVRFLQEFNGEGAYLNGQHGCLFGTTSTFKYLHDGTTSYTVYIVFKPLTVSESATPRKIFCTVNGLANNNTVGFQLNYLSRTSPQNRNTLKASIYNGGGGTPGIAEIIGADNTLVVDEYNIIKLVFNLLTPSFSLYVKNSLNIGYTLLGSDTSITGYSSANSVTALQYGGAAGMKMYHKETFFFKRLLTTEEETNLEAYLLTKSQQTVTVLDVPSVIEMGQSNEFGFNPGFPIDTELAGLVNGYTFFCPGNVSPNETGYWTQVQNSLTINPGDNDSCGSVLRYAYNMYAATGVPRWFFRRGVGSTYLIPNGTTASWSALTIVNSNDLFPIFTQTITATALDKMLHVMRKRPFFEQLFMIITENDATDARGLTTQAAYKTECVGWIKGIIDYLLSVGVPRNNIRLRVIMVKAKNIEAFAKGPEVSAAIDDVAANFITENASYSDVVLSLTYMNTNALEVSSVHYTKMGQNGQTNSIGKFRSDYQLSF